MKIDKNTLPRKIQRISLGGGESRGGAVASNRSL
jgi:hypothetical protein